MRPVLALSCTWKGQWKASLLLYTLDPCQWMRPLCRLLVPVFPMIWVQIFSLFLGTILGTKPYPWQESSKLVLVRVTVSYHSQNGPLNSHTNNSDRVSSDVYIKHVYHSSYVHNFQRSRITILKEKISLTPPLSTHRVGLWSSNRIIHYPGLFSCSLSVLLLLLYQQSNSINFYSQIANTN